MPMPVAQTMIHCLRFADNDAMTKRT